MRGGDKKDTPELKVGLAGNGKRFSKPNLNNVAAYLFRIKSARHPQEICGGRNREVW